MRLEYLVLLLSALIWGSLHPVGKLTLREITPQQLAFARALLGSLALLGFCLLSGRGRKLAETVQTGLSSALVLTLTGLFSSSLLSMTALGLLPASVNTLLANTSPLFLALGAFLLFGERIGAQKALALLAGFAGVAVLTLAGAPGGEVTPGSLLGVALALTGSATWAIYTGYGRRAVAGRDPVAMTTLATIMAVPLLGGVVTLTGGFDQLRAASAATWLALVWCGVAATGATFTAWIWALRRLNAASVAAFGYLIPVVAVFLAVLFLGEPLTPALVVALALVLVGVALAQTS